MHDGQEKDTSCFLCTKTSTSAFIVLFIDRTNHAPHCASMQKPYEIYAKFRPSILSADCWSLSALTPGTPIVALRDVPFIRALLKATGNKGRQKIFDTLNLSISLQNLSDNAIHAPDSRTESCPLLQNRPRALHASPTRPSDGHLSIIALTAGMAWTMVHNSGVSCPNHADI